MRTGEKADDERNAGAQRIEPDSQGCSLFFRQRPEEVNTSSIFAMIFEWTKEKLHSIAASCLALEVSETGFHKWKRALIKGNLLHESRRSPDGLTKADKKAQRPENIIKQDFTAEQPSKK